MAIGPVSDWNSGLSDVGSVAPILGAEGLWTGVVFVFSIWFVIACYRIGNQHESVLSQEFSNVDILRNLLAFMEGQEEVNRQD